MFCEMIRIVISMDDETLGERVQRLRSARGWSQRQLGQRANTSGSYISQLEAGAPRPGARLLEQIASALGVPVAELLGEAQDATSEDALLRALAVRYGGAKADPEILEALLKAFARLTPEEQQNQIDMMEWSAERKAKVKFKASRRTLDADEAL